MPIDNEMKTGALLLTDEEVEGLRNRSYDNILTITSAGPNKNYVTPSYPVNGANNGVEFKVRQNMNVLTKYVASTLLKDGTGIDIEGFHRASRELSKLTATSVERYAAGLKAILHIPEEYWPELDRFCHGMGLNGLDKLLPAITNSLDEMVEAIQQYSWLKNDPNAITDADITPEDREKGFTPEMMRQQIVEKNAADYRNAITALKSMTDIQPETETRMLIPMMGVNFSSTMETMVCLHNNHCVKKNTQNQSAIAATSPMSPVVKQEYAPADDGVEMARAESVKLSHLKDEPEQGKYVAQFTFMPFVMPLKLNNEVKYMAMNCSPRDSDQAVRYGDQNGPVECGIFDSMQSLTACGQKSAVKEIPNHGTLDKVLSKSYPANVGVETPWNFYVPKMMEETFASIHRTDSIPEFKNSREYKNFRTDLDAFRREIAGEDAGRLDQEAFTRKLNDSTLLQSAKAYADYCAAHPKSGQRRADRLNAAHKILDLADALNKKKSPVQYAREKILDNLFQGMTNFQNKQDGVNLKYDRKRAMKIVTGRPATQEALYSSSHDKLTQLANMNPDALLTQLAKRSKQLKDAAEAKKKEQQAARVKHNAALQKKTNPPKAPGIGG